MKIEEFISETLKGIIKGVKDSQEFAKENDSIIMPIQNVGTFLRTSGHYYEGNKERRISAVDFDIAVTASINNSNNIAGGIKIVALNLAGDQQQSSLNQSISRLKFSIDIVLPGSGG